MKRLVSGARINKTDSAIVAEYADRWSEGEHFPPITVFNHGDKYVLADGKHRLEAARSLGYLTIDCDVRSGTPRDALLYALGANVSHGLRRTNADKRHCVLIVLNDAEWGLKSDREIARMCGVSNTFVSNVRNELDNFMSTDDSDEEAVTSSAQQSVAKSARARNSTSC